MIELKLGDCLERMKEIKSGSVDAVIADPPFAKTNCKWDSVIPFSKHVVLLVNRKEKIFYEDDYIKYRTSRGTSYNLAAEEFEKNSIDGMWEQVNRIIKPNGAVVLFGAEPFSSALRMSNIKNHKYDWIWEKTQATGHLNANRQPLRSHEIISVFYKKQCVYNPQKSQGHKPMNSGVRKISVQNKTKVYGKTTKELPFGGNTDRYPRTNLVFKSDKQTNYKHPTQKPVKLMEYLIKTYTNENDTLLDFTTGSCTTGVAAVNTNRNFIGIEKDEAYFKIGEHRINEAIKERESRTANTKKSQAWLEAKIAEKRAKYGI